MDASEVEAFVLDTQKRLEILFDKICERDEFIWGKSGEPSVMVSFVRIDDNAWGWYCEIYSYTIELRDDEDCSKRRYRYMSRNYHEMREMVYNAIQIAEDIYKDWS